MSEEKGEEKETRVEEAERETRLEGDIIEERIYMVPLSRAWIRPRNKRSPRAIRIIREFIRRHMKVDEDSIKISNEVNEKIWSRGIQKPPRKIRIKASKNRDGLVTVHLAEGE